MKTEKEQVMEDFRRGMITMNQAKQRIKRIEEKEAMTEALQREPPLPDLTITIKGGYEENEIPKFMESVVEPIMNKYIGAKINVEIVRRKPWHESGKKDNQ